MLQCGNQRTTTERIHSSRYHRGTIHTALLQTCRQINKEARHVPLSINRLCFAGPLNALHFFAFRLPSSVASFVKGVHIEYHYLAPYHEVSSWIEVFICLTECDHLTDCYF